MLNRRRSLTERHAVLLLCVLAVPSSGLYDYSDTYIVSVGCGGGSAECCMLGDVVLITEVCDYDLGHHVDTHEKRKTNSRIMWFPDDSYADYESELLPSVKKGTALTGDNFWKGVYGHETAHGESIRVLMKRSTKRTTRRWISLNRPCTIFSTLEA